MDKDNLEALKKNERLLEKLINLYRSNEILWNLRDSNWYKFNNKEPVLSDIAKELGIIS